MLVSVIVPVYNVEKYLVKCVESILHQTYKDVEVILVDDGSKDSSPAICDDLAQQDSRVKVIHKVNGGLSDARNVGTAMATGDYLLYMDSDDFWASDDNLEILVGEAKRTPECDFIGFNCSYYYEVEDKVVPWVRYSEELAQPTSTERSVMMLLSSGTFPVSACMKLFRREALQGKIEFIKGAYCEDIPWFIELLRQTKRCKFINLYMYMYRKGVSTSISSSYSPKVYSDLLAHLERGVEQCQNWEVSSEFRDAILSLWAYELSILRAMTGYMDKEQQSVERKKLHCYNWLMKYQQHPKVKMVACIQRFVGARFTDVLLYKYMKTRLM